MRHDGAEYAARELLKGGSMPFDEAGIFSAVALATEKFSQMRPFLKTRMYNRM